MYSNVVKEISPQISRLIHNERLFSTDIACFDHAGKHFRAGNQQYLPKLFIFHQNTLKMVVKKPRKSFG